ncbi:MAG: hypothetical protein QM722_04925 [Piscinibacter sp.]
MNLHHLLAALAATFALAACGGGGSATPGDPAEPPAPEATAVGEPIGVATRAVIGSAGGTLDSADGSVRLVVPAGALTRDETVSIQEISHQNHGAPGRAWRIEPQALVPTLPLTLHFRYAETELQGTDAAELRLAYQDARRRWILPSAAAPALDTGTRTLSLGTRRLGDWSRFARLSLSPGAATVKVGQQLALKVLRCEVTGFDAGTDGSDPQLVTDCLPAPQVKTLGPQVNGQSGGNASIGTVLRPDADRAEYVYTAPATVPSPRSVAVSVQTLLSAEPGSPASTFLVSNITIEDGDGCAWVHSVKSFDYEVRVAAFSVYAASGNASYSGTGKLEATGRLQRIGAPGASIAAFSSFGQSASGLVNVHGTLRVNDPAQPYTQAYAASGAPSGLGTQLPPALFVLSIDTTNCSYVFGGSAMTHGSIEGGPGATADAVMTPGSLHFKNMPLAADAGSSRTLAVDALEAPFSLDTEGNGFAPWGSLRAMPFAAGSTLVSWQLRAAAP